MKKSPVKKISEKFKELNEKLTPLAPENIMHTTVKGFAKLPLLRTVTHQVGASPGSVTFIGEKKVKKVVIDQVIYDEGDLEERKNIAVKDITKSTQKVEWVNVIGLHDTKLLKEVGEKFDVHPLILEDIVHTYQRPKIEETKDSLFIVLKMITPNKTTNELTVEQVSIILKNDVLITFQESEGDVFDAVRERIRHGKGRIRSRKEDYLAYALIDAIVDHYFPVLDYFAQSVDDIEEEVFSTPSNQTLNKINKLKRELIVLRRSIYPVRDLINQLTRSESHLISESTEVFLKDVFDHTLQIMDNIDTLRDASMGMMDMYLSVTSNKMNEVMKTLTIMATIFIPLTFIAGIYGMNFEYMPELSYRYGYFIVWGVMLLVGISMLYMFRKREWI